MSQPYDSDRKAKLQRRRASLRGQRGAVLRTALRRARSFGKRGEAQGGSGGHANGHVPDCLFTWGYATIPGRSIYRGLSR